MVNFRLGVPSQTCFCYLMARFRPGVPSQTCFSSSDGTFLARRTIANLLFFIRRHVSGPAYHHKLAFFIRRHVFRRECHRKLAFLHPTARFWPGVPSQTCFSSSDGTILARCTIANLLFFIRRHVSGPAYRHKLAFLHPTAHFSAGVPSQTCFSSSDGTFLARSTIANLLFSI